MSKKETKTTFTSLCGFDFDPKAKGDCYTVCQSENPDEFKACEEHFKAKPAPVKKKAVKGGKGKSKWGHVNGTQAGLIDDCLVGATKLLTLEEIRDFAGAASNARTLHHLKHIVANRGADVQLNKEGKIFWVDGKVKAKGVASISTMVLRKNKTKNADEKKEKK